MDWEDEFNNLIKIYLTFYYNSITILLSINNKYIEMARINFDSIAKYRIWRSGTNIKTGSLGKPGSKLSKKLTRAAIRREYRKYRLQRNKGKADWYAKTNKKTCKNGAGILG